MSKTPRYTGELPPPPVLKQYPNWKQALGEDGAEGQDETTIMPDDVQDHIGPDTQSTAADVTFPDGRTAPALLGAMMGLCDGEIEYLDVYDGQSSWQVELYGESWGQAQYADASKTHGDTSVFPLRVTSRLPRTPDGQPLRFVLQPDGKMENQSDDDDVA